MNLVEAMRLSKKSDREFGGKVYLLASSIVEPLLPFIKAHSILRDKKVEVAVSPFGSFEQVLHSVELGVYDYKVAIVFLWDLLPTFDWRTGVTLTSYDVNSLHQIAQDKISNIFSKFNNTVIYIEAPTLPVFLNVNEEKRFLHGVRDLVIQSSWTMLDRSFFNLAGYLDYGAPIPPLKLSKLGNKVVDLMYGATPKKVLVTDCDNVLWSGVLSEDGREGVSFCQDGKGYKHFIYQSILLKLKSEGVLLAAVSRNSEEVLKQGLSMDDMVLSYDDFVCDFATYNKKSDCISNIAKLLNLGLDAFVFVDDNILEIEEVKGAFPEITTLLFSNDDEKYLYFLDTLKELFQKELITEEDYKRTQLYRKSIQNIVWDDKTKKNSSNMDGYLASINMELYFKELQIDEMGRAFQLINKTNQFNANGLKITQDELVSTLKKGGRLFSGKLLDNGGDHGEVIVALVDCNNVLIRFVMSCRVFMRKIEFAFLKCLCHELDSSVSVIIKKTARNKPFYMFLNELNLLDFVDSSNNELMALNVDDIDTAIYKYKEEFGFIKVVFH